MLLPCPLLLISVLNMQEKQSRRPHRLKIYNYMYFNILHFWSCMLHSDVPPQNANPCPENRIFSPLVLSIHFLPPLRWNSRLARIFFFRASSHNQCSPTVPWAPQGALRPAGICDSSNRFWACLGRFVQMDVTSPLVLYFRLPLAFHHVTL